MSKAIQPVLNTLAVQGILQPDMWNVVPSDRWDWPAIRGMISKVGLRNSLLVAPMPTASTSQILGNNECFEPYTSNIYSRRVLRFAYLLLVLLMFEWLGRRTWLILSWQWWVCCSEQTSPPWFDRDGYLVSFSEKQDYLRGWFCPKDHGDSRWSESNIQVRELPSYTVVSQDASSYVSKCFLNRWTRTVWEIKQKTILDMAIDRGCYIDQSQSLNVHMDQPNFGKLTSLHFHAWSKVAF